MRMLHAHERGAALLTALVLTLVVLMTALAGARGALYGARASTHERDRLLALRMAEAGLADAERDIEGGSDPGSARAAAFAGGTAAAFAADCAGGRPYEGMCRHRADPAATLELMAGDDDVAVYYGTYTGRDMPAGEPGLAAALPRYLIELMPPAPAGHLYRISAVGTGAGAASQAALQAYYLRPLTGRAPGRRVGWREVGNWAALRAAASEEAE